MINNHQEGNLIFQSTISFALEDDLDRNLWSSCRISSWKLFITLQKSLNFCNGLDHTCKARDILIKG
jgi:hypothetical protein